MNEQRAVDGQGAAEERPVTELRIGVAELRRRPGNRQHLHRSVELGELATSTSRLEAPGEVVVELDMEALSDGVVVNGVVRANWAGECRRCLEMATGVLEAPVSEVFKDHPEDDEVLAVDHDSVELGQVVHDAVVLALPMAPLCTEQCAGPDPDAFPVTVEADEADPAPDPRWAALDELRFDSD